MSKPVILLLTDDRPGHEQLSQGIAAAILRRAGAGSVARVTVRRKGPGLSAALAVNARLPSGMLMSVLYGRRMIDFPQAHVLVSAGAETMAASVLLSRARGLPNIHYGSLRRFRPTDFALVLTSYASDADGARRVFAAKPAAFDPDTLGPARRPADWSDGKPRILTLAVGGDAPGCRFTEGEWERLVALLRDSHARDGIAWQVSNSRRTPETVSRRLSALAAEPDGPIVRFVDVRQPGAMRLGELLGPTDALLVTADSSSMVSEGVFARRPVLALAPASFDLGASEMTYRSALTRHRWMATVAIPELDAPRLLAELRALHPQEDNPLDALAAVIGSRVPSLFA